jgi:uncharacterized Ntn-hydrolase superfamily protein
MTWSVIARDADGTLGIAIASRFFAVGALCVHSRAGSGALCTQALMNPLYGATGLALLATGHAAAEVVRQLTATDAGQAQRQLHVLPLRGDGAAFTGEQCVPWCGHQVHADFTLAGNMLAGPEVLEATAAAYRRSRDSGLPMAERLLAALRSGDGAGGDKRGRQSAALRVQRADPYPQLDLRVDDHEQPVVELQRLYDKSLERFQPFVACLPRLADPTGEIDRARLEQRIAEWQSARAGDASQRQGP